MNARLLILLGGLVLVLVLAPFAARAPVPELTPSAAAAAEPRTPVKQPVPATAAPTAAAHSGTDLARTISQVTGVAISPLLGTGAVGAWRYFDTPGPERARLPWFAQPWFWIPALGLVGLACAKDTLGPVTPTALKKPLDVAEVLENKISALVAAGAFVPLLINLAGRHLPGLEGSDAALALDPAGAGLAAATASPLLNALLTPFALIAFAVVWLLGHVFNVLILISPFTTVDTALKLLRTALLGTVVGTSFANPWIGAAWALVIIVVATVLAGWSFRLTCLGSVFLFDVLSRRRRWSEPDPRSNRMFLARDLDDAPLRTYGRISRATDSDGALRFHYRPFLVGRERAVALPPGEYCVGRGFIYSDLLRIDGDDTQRFGILPPRYKRHEDALTRIHRLAPPREVGIRAAWMALRELIGLGPAGMVAARPTKS